MFEDWINKKIVITLKSNSKTIFGTLIFEDSDVIRLELNDSTPFFVNKSDISTCRPYRERGEYDG